jgi:hypothetical protein
MIDNLAGGLQRAFFYPLFFLFLWMFAKKNWWAILISLLIQAFIYPMVFIISLIILIFDLIYRKLFHKAISKMEITVSVLAILLGISVIYIRYLFFTDILISGYLHEELILKYYLNYISPMLIVIISTRFFYNLENTLRQKDSGIFGNLDSSVQKVFIRVILVISILFFSFSFWNDNLLKISKDEYKVYEFIRTTPKNSLILAPLDIADKIPALTYRSILVNSASKVPVGKKYSLAMQERLRDLEKIYSAYKMETVSSLIKEYGINFIIIKLNEHGRVANGNSLLEKLTNSKQVVLRTKGFAIIKTQ